MRKRKLRLALAILLLALLGGLTWLIVSSHGPPEPVYQGKRLSEWLHATDGDPLNEEAVQAIRAIGTNAIPTLLRMLRAHDSILKLKLVGLAQKQNLIKINFLPAENRNSKAGLGFYILGPAASNAVPALIQIYEEKISETSQGQAISSLVSIGPPAKIAVPVLLRTVADTNANGHVRGTAAMALADLHPEPKLVVPTLIECLKDSDPSNVRKFASYALASFGPNAKAAVPALVDLLKDPDARVRGAAEYALTIIDPEAAAKAGIK